MEVGGGETVDHHTHHIETAVKDIHMKVRHIGRTAMLKITNVLTISFFLG